MKRILIPLAIFTLISRPAVFAQDASARSVQYHAQDIVPIHAKLKYTTLIELPATEKIMEAATGDKDFWVVDVVGNFCFVHPAKAGISSNLNLITDKGNIYSFTLQDVSQTGSAQETVKPPEFGGFSSKGAIVYSRQDARQRLDAGVGMAGLQGVPA
jgi:type IV secretion system protein VirB9